MVTIGITEFAQDSLGDIVFVEAPKPVGPSAGDSFTEVESTKSVSDIYAPVSGSIVTINEAARRPTRAARTAIPYGDGWICTIEMTDPSEFGALLDADGYRALTEGGR